jgi:dephospho-CoA kinase
LTEQEARRRIAAQWPTEEKVSRADIVIRTDAAVDETERQVEEALRKLEGKVRRQK